MQRTEALPAIIYWAITFVLHSALFVGAVKMRFCSFSVYLFCFVFFFSLMFLLFISFLPSTNVFKYTRYKQKHWCKSFPPVQKNPTSVRRGLPGDHGQSFHSGQAGDLILQALQKERQALGHLCDQAVSQVGDNLAPTHKGQAYDYIIMSHRFSLQNHCTPVRLEGNGWVCGRGLGQGTGYSSRVLFVCWLVA